MVGQGCHGSPFTLAITTRRCATAALALRAGAVTTIGLPLPPAWCLATLQAEVPTEPMMRRVGSFTPFEQTKTTANTVAVVHEPRLWSKLCWARGKCLFPDGQVSLGSVTSQRGDSKCQR